VIWLVIIYVLAGLATYVNTNWAHAYYKPVMADGSRVPRSTMWGWYAYEITAGVLWPIYWPFKIFVAPLLRKRLEACAEAMGIELEGVDPDEPEDDPTVTSDPSQPIPCVLTSVEWRSGAFELDIVCDSERVHVSTASLVVVASPETTTGWRVLVRSGNDYFDSDMPPHLIVPLGRALMERFEALSCPTSDPTS